MSSSLGHKQLSRQLLCNTKLLYSLCDNTRIRTFPKNNMKDFKIKLFLSIFEEDIVKNVQISNFFKIMNNFWNNLCFSMFFDWF